MVWLMFTYLNSIRGSADLVFLACALVGVTLFVLRGILMLAGSIFDDASDTEHHDASEPVFKFLTLHTLTGFLMVFGLLGLGLRHHLDYPFDSAVGLALVAGIFMMLVVAVVFYGASHLTSQGSVFKISQLVGQPAIVYQRIEADNDGKIQVVIHGVTREVGARSQFGKAIDSFEHVKIVGVVDNYTVLVQPHHME